MKIGVLTSSRADFGIYLPLLDKIDSDPFFELSIIAFGTHVSQFHGETIHEIRSYGFNKIKTISSLLIDDSPAGISSSYGITVMKFADHWESSNYDLVLCLGDRFEMSAAVQAGIPFNIKFGHIHGGETTSGAIDDVYRHQITLASDMHFVSTQVYKDKILNLLPGNEHVYNVGSLSLDGIEAFDFTPEDKFRAEFKLGDKPFVLTTFHPDTVNTDRIHEFSTEICAALEKIQNSYNVVITMPNADTLGSILRDQVFQLGEAYLESVKCIENFGKLNYFNAMRYCEFLLGNSSSGIIEAASFGKFVINVGSRQEGRAQSENIIACNYKSESIIAAVEEVKKLGYFKGTNIYRKDNAADSIIKIIKSNYASL